MKITHHLLLFVIAVALNACINKEQKSKVDKEESLEEIYLGQNPPGTSPILFAPDLIGTEYREAAVTFSPDAKEFYFRRRGGEYINNALVVVKPEENQWVESIIAPKSGEPFIAPDGKTMHLGRNYRIKDSIGWSAVK